MKNPPLSDASISRVPFSILEIPISISSTLIDTFLCFFLIRTEWKTIPSFTLLSDMITVSPDPPLNLILKKVDLNNQIIYKLSF